MHIEKLIKLLIINILFIFFSSIYANNLVTNGSFEDHGSLNYGNKGIYTEIPGWNLDKGHFEIHRGRTSGIKAASGRDKLELDANRNSSIHTLLDTEIDQTYILKFSYSPRIAEKNTNTNNIKVWWDNKRIITLSGDKKGWVHKSYIVNATSISTKLKFSAAGKSDGLGGFIDNIQVIPLDALGLNKIENGSFEQYGVLNHGNWGTFKNIPHWKATTGLFEVQTRNVSGIRAVDGIAKVELDGFKNSTMMQKLTDLQKGEKYQLVLSYSPRIANDKNTNKINVRWNNKKLATLNGKKKGWKQYTYTVNANSVNRLKFQAIGKSDKHGGLIDDIQLYCLTCERENNPPVADSISETTDEDAAKAITLIGADPESDPLTYTIATQPANGVLSGEVPNLIYTPNADYNGLDSFDYTVSDSVNVSAVTTVSITINAVNDIPIANPDSVMTKQNIAKEIILSGIDVDSEELQYVITTQPEHGVLSGTVPNITYTPNAGYSGMDSFGFTVSDSEDTSSEATVSISVLELITIPPVANSATVVTDEDTAASITLTGSDAKSRALSFEVATQPVNGALTGSAPNIIYTPNTNYSGSDSFTFLVSDGENTSVPATISITVEPVNDLPTVDAGTNQTVIEGTSIQLSATANDIDGQIVTQQWAEAGLVLGDSLALSLSTLSVGEHTLTITVTDNEGATASDDLKVTVEKKPNTAPVAENQTVTIAENTAKSITLVGIDNEGDELIYTISANPLKGTLSGVAPNVIYTPNSNESGTDVFKFTVNDGEIISPEATVTINIDQVNSAPVVNAGLDRTIVLGAPVTLQANASDVDGIIVSYEWNEGSDVVGNAQGVVLTSLALGEHIFNVLVTDSDGLTATDSVKITVEEDSVLPGSLTGKVIDQKGIMIINAKVKLPTGQVTTSDANGDYLIRNIKPTERSTVTASKNNFLQNSEIIIIEPGKETSQNIVLSRPKSLTEIIPNEGSQVNTEGMTIEIPPSTTFITESGDNYVGPVMLSASYFPITTEAGANEFPGDTLAITDDGEIGDLESFGILKLELKDDSGKTIELSGDQQIELSIPADDSLEKPATIPFWIFDENKGLWVEDGVATYDPLTDTYKTAVDSVGTFNLDAYRGGIASLEVCVEDSQGNKLTSDVILQPLDKTWIKTSRTSEDGLLRLERLFPDNNFNLFAGSSDGRLGEYALNPIYVDEGSNKVEECIIVDDSNNSDSFSISGRITDINGNAKPNINIKIQADADGLSFGDPGLVELTKVLSDADGRFIVNFSKNSAIAKEVGLLGNRKITIEAAEDGNTGDKELIVESGTLSYDVGDITLILNEPPVAYAGPDRIAYLGDVVTIDAYKSVDPDGLISNYELRKGDQVFASGNSSKLGISSLGLGTHLLVLTVTDQFGLKSSDEIKVTIIEKDHQLHAIAGLDRFFLLGEKISISAEVRSIGSDVSSIEWKTGNTVLSTGYWLNNPNLGLGTHPVILTVTNEYGLKAVDQISITITESEQNELHVNLGTDLAINLGDEGLQLSDSSFVQSIGSPLVYGKYFVNNELVYEQDYSQSGDNYGYIGLNLPYWALGELANPLEPGVHNLRLEVSNRAGLVESDDIDFNIQEKTKHYLIADAGLDQSFYLGDGGYIGNNTDTKTIGSPYASTIWTEGNTVLLSSNEDYYSPSINSNDLGLGSHTLTRTIKNKHGLEESDQVTINIVNKPVPSGDIFADAGLDKTIYEGDQAFFGYGNKSTSVNGGLQYEWSIDGNVISTSEYVSYYSPQVGVGTHVVTLTVTDSQGLTASDDLTLTIVPKRPILVVADAGLDINAYEGDGIYIPLGEDTSPSYKNDRIVTWSIGNEILLKEGYYGNDGIRFGINSASSSNPALDIGTYVLTLKVSDLSGQIIDTDELTITVVEKPQPPLVIDIGNDKSVYLGSRTLLQLRSSTGYLHLPNADRKWMKGDEVLSTDDHFYYEANEIGEHTITVVLTDEITNEVIGTDDIVINVVKSKSLIYADAGLDKIASIDRGVSLGGRNNSFSLTANITGVEWSIGDQVITNGYSYFSPSELGITETGTYKVKLTITDSDGLTATDEVNIILLDDSITDNTPPKLTLNGQESIVITQGQTYIEEGATANDDRDGVLTESIVITNPILNTFNTGNYTINYSVKDNAGNEATISRFVEIIPGGPDNTPPTITLIGENPHYMNQGTDYVDAGITAIDNRDGVLGYSFNTNINKNEVGDYEVTYSAEDGSGNTATKTRTVIVTSNPDADVTKPVIELIGESVVEVIEGNQYVELGATAVDDIDGNITGRISISGTVNINVIGSYLITYSVSDTAGNIATINRTVNVADTPDVVPAILTRSLEWIETQTESDGSYSNNSRLAFPLQSTAEVLRAYNVVGEVSALGIVPATSFINNQVDSKVEILSRKIIFDVEAGNDVSVLITKLLQLQNIDGGFGDQEHYHSRVVDTAFALQALGISGFFDINIIGRAIDYLKTQRSSNGGFSHSSKNQDSVYETAIASIALQLYLVPLQQYQDTFDLPSLINSSTQYLMNNQISGGGWDSHWETGYALLAITVTTDNFVAYQLAADRLKAAQLSNGSWDNDVYTTALCIRALYKSENLNTP